MSVSLTLYIKKISNTHHEFRYVRPDGTGETLKLETKSFLLHDLIHFVVERRAKLENSFYGLLARSESYKSLSDENQLQSDFGGEIGMTERIVGGLTPVIKGDITPEQFLAGARNLMDAYQKKLPYWLDQGFIADVQDDLRSVIGEWNDIVFGDTLILKFNI